MAKRKDAEDWLEWAQAKYDAAQERFAWSDRSDSPTLDSYSTLISLIESENAKLRHEIFDKHMELPLGADGVPIRLGDLVWYVGPDHEITNDDPQQVVGLVTVFAADGIYVMTRDYTDKAIRPELLTHKAPEPPDSWEKLLGDLDRARNEGHGDGECLYADCASGNCGDCRFDSRQLEPQDCCIDHIFGDIARRIRALREVR